MNWRLGSRRWVVGLPEMALGELAMAGTDDEGSRRILRSRTTLARWRLRLDKDLSPASIEIAVIVLAPLSYSIRRHGLRRQGGRVRPATIYRGDDGERSGNLEPASSDDVWPNPSINSSEFFSGKSETRQRSIQRRVPAATLVTDQSGLTTISAGNPLSSDLCSGEVQQLGQSNSQHPVAAESQ
ncbi:unnamed protein product [Cuscuta campestris]|uniref:Uncharacterized protein n=1 Tax=Cuscuta campestris TaxID=132261 RepID=A0A484KIL1_9ASTE|nr:unnamed protein product [Cuscuta campestris]